MGLLDLVMTAKGDSSDNYGKAGRHVMRLNRLKLRDPSEPGADPTLKPGFKFDGEVLHSNRSDHVRGDVITFNDPFKFPGSALARVRRLLAAAKTAKTGKVAPEATMGIEPIEGEADAAYAARISAEVKRLLGPEQPLGGAIITVVATEGKNKQTGTPYTLFDVYVPTEDDLKNAGFV